ncbi:RING finger protein, partial [Trifolium medium]|nr:RING finger protein [Trifolium medium]
MAVVEDSPFNADINAASDQDSSRFDASIEEKVCLKEEISYMVERTPHEVLEMDLLADQR